MEKAVTQGSSKQANAKLLTELQALNDELQVPTPAQFGIDRARFFELMPTMAQQALASGSPGNNPRVPTVDQMVGLYSSLW